MCMGKPGPDPKVTQDAVLRLFAELDDPCTPLTAQEVADELECSRSTALRRLNELHDEGDLNTKKVGARGRVWWQSYSDCP